MRQEKNEEEWKTLHISLKETLQKEVNITRELLTNMHQEELSLLFKDQGSLQELLHQRAAIIERLSSLRSVRIQTTEKIQDMLPEADKNSEKSILPLEEEMSTEIFSLRDQLMALTEQMNRQNTQNQHLIEHPESVHSLFSQKTIRAKRKAAVATYQIKK